MTNETKDSIELSIADIEAIASDEETRWIGAHKAIIEEIHRTGNDYERDRDLARELTAELVAATREEDMMGIASDEAVAHGLTKLRKSMSKDFDGLAKQPYFARVVTDESGKNVEFRLGTASFPSQRIVDWRKAPISRLYYNYREGEEFSELIQGREREGFIKIKRSFEGEEADLRAIEIPSGIIRKGDTGWAFDSSNAARSRTSGHDGHLPPILSLITAEQFDLITRDSKRPVIIQGIAGSGKTTVALHRLAWLLHEDNSDAKPANCLVIVHNRALASYIETTLPELGIKGVRIITYGRWIRMLGEALSGPRKSETFERIREAELFKSSADCLRELEAYVASNDRKAGTHSDDLFNFMGWLSKRDLMWRRWDDVKAQFAKQAKERLRDEQDDSIMANLVWLREGFMPTAPEGFPSELDHIVIDEAQDFGIVEIRAMLAALGTDRTATIVGDSSQHIAHGRQWSGWSEILTAAGLESGQPIELTVPYRTTREIMEVASFVLSDASLLANAAGSRHGRNPKIIKADGFETEPHFIGQWMKERLAEAPKSLSAVICRWPHQAEKLTNILLKLGHSYVRWGHRDSFSFSPGVIITNAAQVKGLEFRNVLLVNPTTKQYNPDSDEEQRLLYVAVTRAEEIFDIIVVGDATPLLPPMERMRYGTD